MLNNLFKLFALVLILLFWLSPVKADNLGRLFTSSEERLKLEKVRHAKPKKEKVEVVEVEEIIEPVKEEKEEVIRDAIALKGIVRRSDGKNTAWLNNSNTFEGDLESQYIQINNEEIASDHVKVIMPDNQTKIKIKVGEYYDPNTDIEKAD